MPPTGEGRQGHASAAQPAAPRRWKARTSGSRTGIRPVFLSGVEDPDVRPFDRAFAAPSIVMLDPLRRPDCRPGIETNLRRMVDKSTRRMTIR
jgi:hypothetical protein